MAIENLGKCVPLPANADLSAAQYYIVKLNTSGKVAACGDGQRGNGVLQNDPAAADRAATVMVGDGITKGVVGGVVTAGDQVASDSSGRFVTAASGDYILGIALETSTTAGQIIAVLWQPCPAKL